ncbi:MAG TPA: MASE3 domain-containing protein [Noviherbaspirillum sp.]
MKLYGTLDKDERALITPTQLILGVVIVVTLHLTSLYSYVLFHSLLEMLQLTVIFGIFAITWHSRKWSSNNYLTFVGLSFPFIGIVILLHTLAYKGMGVFRDYDANLPTQLWIAQRYLQSVVLLIAPMLIGRRFRTRPTMTMLSVVTAFVIFAIFARIFPDCFVEGKGLTPFKIYSEYVISLILLGGVVMLVRRRAAFDAEVRAMLMVSLVAGTAAELAFTAYVSVYGLANEIGHFFLLLSTYFMYRAILVTGIVNPFRLLFLGLKQKEEELEAKVVERTLEVRQSEERFHGLADVAQDAILMIDDKGCLTYWNASAERIFGYRFDEVAGKEVHRVLAPDRYLPAYEKGFRAFQDSGTGPVLGKVIEVTAIRKDGTEFPVSLSVSALRLNERWHAVGILRDITERKHADELRAKLAAIVESTSVGIIGKDLDGHVTSWNIGAEKVYGYTAEEMIGRPISVLADEKRKTESAELIDKVKRGEVISRFETTRVRKDGRVIDVSLTVSPVYDAEGALSGVSTVVSDITDRKKAERELIAVNRVLKTLSCGNMTLIHATDEGMLLVEMCRTIVEVGGYRFAWVGYVRDDDRKTIAPMARYGAGDGYLEAFPLTWSEDAAQNCPEGDAIRMDAVQIHQNLDANCATATWCQAALKHDYRSVIALPLRGGGRVIGVLAIFAGEIDTFQQAEVRLLTEMAADLSYGITALRTRVAEVQGSERLKKSMESTIRAIASTIEMRDPYTSGHQQRVAELGAAIGREMGLDESRVYGIYLSGIVHDLGKINVPAEILCKPGRLQEVEFELIKGHAKAGHDILMPVDFPWPIADIVLQHHERVDGSGYPNGLTGDAILLEARIIAVADVVEAISSHRPYRPAFGIEAGLKEIRTHRGTKYDPAVVDACLKLFNEGRFQFGTERAFGWESAQRMLEEA